MQRFLLMGICNCGVIQLAMKTMGAMQDWVSECLKVLALGEADDTSRDDQHASQIHEFNNFHSQ